MSPSEDVLRDLLLEHGIEGVTLWHIKALAAYQYNRAHWNGRGLHPNNRMESDLRGEETVTADAAATNLELDAQRKYRPSGGDCDHDFIATPEGEICVRCGGIPPRAPGEYELDEINAEPYDPHYLDQD